MTLGPEVKFELFSGTVVCILLRDGLQVERAEKWCVLNLYCCDSSGRLSAGSFEATSSLSSTLSAAAAGVMAAWSRPAGNRVRSWPLSIASTRVRGILDSTEKRNQNGMNVENVELNEIN